MTIWVCGEVLVDRIGESNILGGGPANTARAVARLGQEVEFVGGISRDEFGERACKEFSDDKVGLHHVHRSEKPTAIAAVSLDANGVAKYEFTTSETATFDFSPDWLPDPSRFKPSLLHIGSLATVIEPGAASLFEWAVKVSEFAPIIFDPNVRTGALDDHAQYLEIFERWASISTVVKASDEDIDWLYPDQAESAITSRLLDSGLQLLLITRGSGGISGSTRDERVEVEGVVTEVVDTVGAGDTVGAVVADALVRRGILNLHGDVLRETLNCAVYAAAITCSRAGAEPPTRSEIDAALLLAASGTSGTLGTLGRGTDAIH